MTVRWGFPYTDDRHRELHAVTGEPRGLGKYQAACGLTAGFHFVEDGEYVPLLACVECASRHGNERPRGTPPPCVKPPAQSEAVAMFEVRPHAKRYRGD